jgi:dihydrodipicolinate synthase/N-acetylneuraminate lyase
LKKRGVPKAERAVQVAKTAELLQLTELLGRKPRQLSGGQQQRVALGRALVRDPKVFLLDEPLSNLDAKLRGYMRVELVELHRRLGRTMVYVTHDQLEAMTMSDRIAVMEGGRLQQFAPPTQVYQEPANRFVAGFIGTPGMNLIDGRLAQEGGRWRFEAPGIALTLDALAPDAEGGEACLGLRPEDVTIGTGPHRRGRAGGRADRPREHRDPEAGRPSHHRPRARGPALAPGRTRADRPRRRPRPCLRGGPHRAPPEPARAGPAGACHQHPPLKAGPRGETTVDRTSVTWTGPMPAITTPFRRDLSIDEESFTANIARLFDAGATGMVAAGCTGEFWALKLPEREHLARLTVAACKGRGPAIVGTGSIREGEVIDQIHAAKEAGADGVLVMPPYFAHLTEAEVIAHFEAIDAGSPLPIVLYNIPGNAGNAITPAIADRLADLDHVVAIKESSGDWTNFHDTLLRVHGRIRVYCGPSSVFGVAATLAGADGLIDCFPNVWDGCLDLWHSDEGGPDGRGVGAAAHGPGHDRAVHDRGPHALPGDQGRNERHGPAGRRHPAPALAGTHGRAAGGADRRDGQPACAPLQGGVIVGHEGRRPWTSD